MADTAAPPQAPAVQTAAPAAESEQEPGGLDWGKIIDAAGLVAAGILVVIVADILTDGRVISRRLFRRPQQETGEQVEPANVE